VTCPLRDTTNRTGWTTTSFYSRRMLKAAFALIVGVPLGACDSTQVTPPIVSRDGVEVSHYITPAVTLDAKGLFLENELGVLPYPTIDRAAAVDLAQGFIKHQAKYQRALLERQHGAKLDFDALRQAGRVVLLDTPYEAVEDAELTFALRNRWGPYFPSYSSRMAFQL
jgi:hypothetical protein